MVFLPTYSPVFALGSCLCSLDLAYAHAVASLILVHRHLRPPPAARLLSRENLLARTQPQDRRSEARKLQVIYFYVAC
jgi:hypothetical protein